MIGISKLVFSLFVYVLAGSVFLMQNVAANNERSSVASESIESSESCKQFILNFSNEVINVEKAKFSQAERKKQFVDIAGRYIAIENVAKFLLSANYRKLTADEKEKVHVCVKNLVATRLVAELPHGESIAIKVTDVKSPSAKHWMITVEYFVDGKKYEVVFSIFDRKNGLKIFDVIVGGVGASKVQRADIDGKIAKDGFKKFFENFLKNYAN